MTLVAVAKAAAVWGPRLLLWCASHLPTAAPTDSVPWRLVGPMAPIRSDNVHVGVRPHGDPGEAAVTVQITFRTLW